MPYDVHLEIFEGPLDLLLYLIRKSDLEISDIPIAQITQEYLEYIDIMKELNLEIAGEFLVMASTLMQIKTRMLLPSHDAEQEEGDELLEELKSKLLEYQKYKEVARQLGDRESEYQNIYYRPPMIFDKDDYVLDVTLFDLINGFRNVLRELPTNVKEIVYEEIPIEQKIRELLDLLEGKEYLSFKDVLMRESTKIGLILSFLAILELIRLKQIIAKQSQLFGEIRIYRVKEEKIEENVKKEYTDQKELNLNSNNKEEE
ncbi:MAG: segregation/condensation protein A [Endomicrobiales bacterium]|nr:segregation/condensation protein A [Endomicrobiales bacterium]